jgi:hypothetical protein
MLFLLKMSCSVCFALLPGIYWLMAQFDRALRIGIPELSGFIPGHAVGMTTKYRFKIMAFSVLSAQNPWG